MRHASFPFTLFALLLFHAPAFASGGPTDYHRTVSGSGLQWDLYLWDFSLTDGTSDAYDGAGAIALEHPGSGVTWNFWDSSGAYTIDSSQTLVTSGVVPLGSAGEIDVQQVWYFPFDAAYARQTVFLTNTAGADATYNLWMHADLGSNERTSIIATSSGDAIVDDMDLWCRSWDTGWGDPHVAFQWGDGIARIGNDPTLGEDQGGWNDDQLDLQWLELSLPAGQTLALLIFHFQAWTDSHLQADMDSIWSTAEQAFFEGLSPAQVLSVFNWDLADIDGDGETSSVFGGPDCDDGDPEVSAGGVETCDGVDNDCDGLVDEGATTAFYLDLDGDGWGDPDAVEHACSAPSALWITGPGDCDDTDDDNHPAAEEVCSDGQDNNCDGTVDEKPCTKIGGCGGDLSAGASAARSAGWLALLPLVLVLRRR
jgi:hypothetical protein